MQYDTFVPSAEWLIVATISALILAAIVLLIARRWGPAQLTNATLIPVFAILIFLLGFHGHELDLTYSARPLAREIQHQAPGVKLLATTSDVSRDIDYGLAFYRNRPTLHYAQGIPNAEHILVVRAADATKLDSLLAGRIYKPLFLYETQGLAIYRVDALP